MHHLTTFRIAVAFLVQTLCLTMVFAIAGKAQPVAPGAHECIPFERSMLLSDRSGPVEDVIGKIATSIDSMLGLQPGAFVADNDPEAFCAGVIAGLNGPLGARGNLARTMPGIQVLTVLRRGAVPKIDIYANVPGLAHWAGDPFVRISTFTGDETSSPTLSDDLTRGYEIAVAYASALRAFLEGDPERAIRLRPPPDELEPIARAWAMGIPIGTQPGGPFSTEEDPVFDSPPSKGGGNQFAVFLAVARGEMTSDRAIELNTPANDVNCDGGITDDRAGLNWARFVSGFWQALDRIAEGESLEEGVWLGSLSSVFRNGRTCFDAMLFPMLDSLKGRWTLTDAYATLGTLADVRFAGSDTDDARAQLATRMAASAIAMASFQETESETRFSGDTIERLGACRLPVGSSAPFSATFTEFDLRPNSPLTPILALARHTYAEQSPDTKTLEPLLVAPAGAWLGSSGSALDSVVTQTRLIDRALTFRIAKHYDHEDFRDDIAFLVGQLRHLDDAAYADEKLRLQNQLARFDVKSDVAISLITKDIQSYFLSTTGNKTNIRAYQRLLDLRPELSDDSYLQTLFDSASKETAIRVAAIDIMHFLFGNRTPHADRDPWLLFAADATSLPDSAIPPLGASSTVNVWIVAASTSIRTLLDTKGRGLPTHRLALPALVSADAMWQYANNKDDTLRDYFPSPAAHEISAKLDPRDIDWLFQSLSDEVMTISEDRDITALAEVADIAWAKYARPYLIQYLLESRDEAQAHDLADDIERAFRLMYALQDPAHRGGVDVATDVLNRVRDQAGWSDDLQRFSARVALAALRADRAGTAALDPADMTAVRDEFDTLVPPQTRQNLIDAGFFPAALTTAALELLLQASAHGGLLSFSNDTLIEMLLDAAQQYDLNNLAREDLFADLVDVLIAFRTTDATENQQFVSDMFDLLEPTLDIDALSADRQPSDEASALVSLIVRRLDLDPGDDTSHADPNDQSRDILNNIEQIARACPELATSLYPLHLSMARLAGTPVDISEELNKLRSLVVNGDHFTSVRLRVESDILGMRSVFEISQSPSVWPIGGQTGKLDLKISASSKGLLSGWKLGTDLGLIPAHDRSSPAFAMALELAHIADEAGDIAALDTILSLIETLAMGGNPHADDKTELPGIQSDKTLRYGIRATPRVPLWPRVSTVRDPDLRLLRLAAIADKNNLTALAWRLSGLALGVALETPEPKKSKDDDEPDPLTDLRHELKNQFNPTRNSSSGFRVARRAAARKIAFPAGFADAALCPPDNPGCAATTFLIDDSLGFGDLPLVAADAPCEAAARGAVLRARPAISNLDRCLHGLLRFDYEVHPSAPGIDMIGIANAVGDAGYGTLLLERHPRNVGKLMAFTLKNAPADDKSEMLGKVATVAYSLDDHELAVISSYLSLLATIADPGTVSLDKTQSLAATELLTTVSDEKLREIFERIGRPDAVISAPDKAYAAQVIQQAVTEN